MPPDHTVQPNGDKIPWGEGNLKMHEKKDKHKKHKDGKKDDEDESEPSDADDRTGSQQDDHKSKHHKDSKRATGSPSWSQHVDSRFPRSLLRNSLFAKDLM